VPMLQDFFLRRTNSAPINSEIVANDPLTPTLETARGEVAGEMTLTEISAILATLPHRS